MPDIVITPNRGTTNNPKIDFTGTSAGTIKLEVLADGSIAWNGANGSLFSIADSLSGSLMSVNDISGLPAFEVFSDNRVIVGQFGAKLGIGITNPSYKLDVSGTARISGATIFSSATTFNGGNGSQVNGNGSTLSLTVNGNWNSGVGSLIQLTTSDLNFWSNGGIYYFKNSAGGNAATINSTNGNIETTGGFAANRDGDSGNLVNGVSLWSTSNATTSISYFKRWSAIFGRANTLLTEATGYATYHLMDTAGRGWVWRYISSNNTSTGTNVASLRNDTGQFSIGKSYDWSGGYHAQLNISAGEGSATTYRDIDLHGSWSAGEGHAITATYSTGANNIVGQIVFQYDSPNARIRFGKLHYNGDTSSYPLELIATSATAANLILNNGNVGLGVTGPSHKLHFGAGSFIGLPPSFSFVPSSWTRGSSGIIMAGSNNADGSGWSYGGRIVEVDEGDGLNIAFDVNYTNSWTNNAMVISGRAGKLGNVGIGTTSPGYKLDVSGTTNTTKLNVAGYSMRSSATIDMSNTGTYSTSNFYPVTIPLSGYAGGHAMPIRMRILNSLNSNVPSWSTHGSGFTCHVEWTTNGSGWGTIAVQRSIHRYTEGFTNSTICGGISQLTNDSIEVIWLRGGGIYYFEADADVTPTPRSTNYTAPNGGTANVVSVAMNNVIESALNTNPSFSRLNLTQSTGTAPFTVSSTTQVTNLNAQYLNGYSSDTANTANAIVRRDASGFINVTAAQTSSGGANGVRVHTNSGITASNSYMNFFTSQTNGWAFNTNGTGADANTVVVINASGNVGIGTTSPAEKLHVNGGNLYLSNNPTTNDWGAVLENTNTGGWGVSQFFKLYGYGSSPAGAFAPLQIRASYPGFGQIDFLVKNQAQSTAIAALSILGTGNVGIRISTPSDVLDILGTTGSTGGRITFGDGGNYTPYMRFYKWTGTSTSYYQTTIANSITASGALEFYTGGGGAAIGSDTQSLRMIILQGGNVGIGTTTPSNKLHLLATTTQTSINANDNQFLIIENTANGSQGLYGIGFKAQNGITQAGIFAFNGTNGGGNGDLRFYTRNTSGTLQENMRLSDAGVLTVGGNIVLNASNYTSYALPLSGGTMTGVITTPNGTHGIIIGDDSRLADRNVANTLFLEGNANTDRGYINFSTTSGNALGAINAGDLTWRGNSVIHAGNYHDYALGVDFPATTGATGYNSSSGTWNTSASTTEWGSYKPGNDTSAGYAWNDAPGWVQYNVPSGYSTVYIGQLRWSSGGYFDVHAVMSDGSLVFRGRYLSLNTIETTSHSGNHDGQQIIKVSGLDGMTAVRITNVSGRLHLQGLGWTKEQDTAGTQVSETHWDVIYNKPAFTSSATTASATANTANTLVLRDGSGNFAAGGITTSTQVATTKGTLISEVTPGLYANAVSTGNAIGIVSKSGFANQGAWANIALNQTTANANDLTAGVHMTIGGWFENSGSGLPIYLGCGYVSEATPTMAVKPANASGGGNVGIGTTSPASKLHVASAGNVSGGTILMGPQTNNAAKWSNLCGTHYANTAEPEGIAIIGCESSATANRVAIGGGIWESNPATEISFYTYTATTHNLGGSLRMIIDTNGNVGIGTSAITSPNLLMGTPKFVVNGATSTIANATSGPAYSLIKSTDSSTTIGLMFETNTNYFVALQATGSTYGGYFALQPNMVEVSSPLANGILIRASNATGYIDFATGGNNSKMRLTSDGNVGIGSTTTIVGGNTYKLYVAGGQFGTILQGGDGGSGSDVVRMIKSDASLAMLVRGDGNVGIGQTSPSYKLDVNGSFRTATGNLTIFNDYIYVSANNANTLNSAYSTNATADMWINYRGYNDGHTQFRNFNVGDGKGANIAWFDGTNKRMSINNGQSASYTLHVVGDIYSSTTVRDQYGDLRTLPENAKTAAYTLAASDTGRLINITTGGITVPASIFSIGQVVTIYNNSASNQTITQGASVTMYLAGTATTGNRTLAQRGVATVICVASNTFVISGSGLT